MTSSWSGRSWRIPASPSTTTYQPTYEKLNNGPGEPVATTLSLSTAAEAVGSLVDTANRGASLLPQVENLRTVSATVAVAVARRAAEEGLARADLTDPVQQVHEAMWQPVYRPVKAA